MRFLVESRRYRPPCICVEIAIEIIHSARDSRRFSARRRSRNPLKESEISITDSFSNRVRARMAVNYLYVMHLSTRSRALIYRPSHTLRYQFLMPRSGISNWRKSEWSVAWRNPARFRPFFSLALTSLLGIQSIKGHGFEITSYRRTILMKFSRVVKPRERHAADRWILAGVCCRRNELLWIVSEWLVFSRGNTFIRVSIWQSGSGYKSMTITSCRWCDR